MPIEADSDERERRCGTQDHEVPIRSGRCVSLGHGSRLAVALILAVGACWLVVSVLLLMLASIKLRAPEFVGASCFLSYGRLQPAGLDALVFGFCVPVGHAVASWILSVSTGVSLSRKDVGLWCWAVWNLGVLIGTIGILGGDGTGIEWLELPGYASRMLLFSSMVFTVWVLGSVWRGSVDLKGVRQWHCVGALLLFPWVYGAVLLGTVYGPSRGVVGASTQAWFVQMLLVVWGGYIGLGALRGYSSCEESHGMATDSVTRFGFWALVLFGGLGALQRLQGGPFPAWMIAVGNASTALCLLPFCAVLVGFKSMLGQQHLPARLASLRSVVLSAIGFYGLALLLAAMTCFSFVGLVVQFTTFRQGIDMSLLVGFLIPSLLFAIHWIMPLVTRQRWPERSYARAHYFAIAGGALIVAGLTIGGVVQGAAWNNPEVPVGEVIAQTRKWLGMASCGWVLVLGGAVLFAVDACTLVVRGFQVTLWPQVRVWFQADTEGKEAGA